MVRRSDVSDTDAEKDAKQRGRSQSGRADEVRVEPKRGLPRVNRAYRISSVNQRIDRLIRSDKPRARIKTFFPYLFVRSAPGDMGARPLQAPMVSWESCDIHLMPVASRGFDFSKTVLQPVVGQMYKVFVHTWNLGRFAAYGARLRVWWVEPGFFNGTISDQYQPHYIGGAFFSLGDRDSTASHRLIEVPQPWRVPATNLAHECLIAAVDCATDPWDGVMQSSTHRHVAQRNLSLITGSNSLDPPVRRLGAMMTDQDTEMLVGHLAIKHAGLSGAQERGFAGAGDVSSWDHTGDLVIGGDLKLLVGIRRTPNGLRTFDLRRLGMIPLPGSSAAAGRPVTNLSSALPKLIETTLGIRSLRASEVAGAMATPAAARVLRFAVTGASGRTSGYTIIVAP
jgi:hypothetical protein